MTTHTPTVGRGSQALSGQPGVLRYTVPVSPVVSPRTPSPQAAPPPPPGIDGFTIVLCVILLIGFLIIAGITYMIFLSPPITPLP